MNILLIGPQASGKGTQAEKLIKEFDIAYVEMGSLLRNIVKEDSELGRKVNDYMMKGELVPDEIANEVVNNYLGTIARFDGILFDGFPRVLSQAEYFEKYLSEKGKKIDVVIYLTLPTEETFKRLINRRTCSKCGRVYNLLTKPPKVEGTCDYCASELIVRKDESPQQIKARLDTFEERTKPLLEFYRKRGILEEVDGNRSIEEIFNDIVERIRARKLV